MSSTGCTKIEPERAELAHVLLVWSIMLVISSRFERGDSTLRVLEKHKYGSTTPDAAAAAFSLSQTGEIEVFDSSYRYINKNNSP